jgi:hypothetical protein
VRKFFQGFMFEVSKEAAFPIQDVSAVSKMVQKLRGAAQRVPAAADKIKIKGNRGAGAYLSPV